MKQTPQIIVSGGEGVHNADLAKVQKRLLRGKTYKDLSTVCVIPTRGMIPARVVESWMGLMTPMNNPFVRIMVEGMEVGDAYNSAIELILGHEQLKTFRYMLTLEEDNVPPPDGLLRLFESIGKYSAVGGLYFTKGEEGQPMIYGDPKGILAFQPQVPLLDKVQECNGLGMGFTLFDLAMFRDKRIPKPWFKTLQQYTPGAGVQQGTQDLYFYGNARRAGYRIASDNRVKVGHYDHRTGILW